MRQLSNQEIKNVCLDILRYVDSICRRNNLKYFIGFGTLIGAIRHKGFIPWDDDIDICMFRDDYEKFVEIMKKQDKYKLINPKTDKNYYWSFARVSDKSTKLVLKGLRKVEEFGCFVDVFPIDNAPPKNEVNSWYEEYKKYEKKVKVTIPSSCKYEIQTFKSILWRIKTFPLRILYGSKNFTKYRNQFLGLITKYNSSETNMCIISSTPYNIRAIFDKKIFDDVVEVEFEKIKVFAPAGYKDFLKKLYGDYMKLPPIEKQVTHHHFIAYWRDEK